MINNQNNYNYTPEACARAAHIRPLFKAVLFPKRLYAPDVYAPHAVGVNWCKALQTYITCRTPVYLEWQ